MKKILFLVGVVLTVSLADAWERFGVPFSRYSTGHPGAPYLQPGEAWIWNPDGDAPGGQIPCDRQPHRLAKTDVGGLNTSGWIVNSQVLVALDRGADADLQGWATRLRGGQRSVIQQTGKIDHPATGYPSGNIQKQNLYRSLWIPVHIRTGDVLEYWMSCAVKRIRIANIYGPCGDGTIPCASGVWV